MTNKLEEFNNFVFFKTDQGKVNIDVFFKNNNLWLTQKKMAELFEVDRTVITKHLNSINKELDKNSTSVKIAQLQKEGNRKIKRELEYYNLETIISVGYRVNSYQARKFRIGQQKLLKSLLSRVLCLMMSD